MCVRDFARTPFNVCTYRYIYARGWCVLVAVAVGQLSVHMQRVVLIVVSVYPTALFGKRNPAGHRGGSGVLHQAY